jgi:hypothetical protein
MTPGERARSCSGRLCVRVILSHRAGPSGLTQTSGVFANFPDAPRKSGQREFFLPIIHELAQELAVFDMPIRYRLDRRAFIIRRVPVTHSVVRPGTPLEAVQSSCINAELVFRRIQIQDSLTVTLPAPGAFSNDVRRR